MTRTEAEAQLRALTKTNGAFSQVTPGLQLVWDSTSLGLLKTCPYKYYLQQICGWVPKRQATPLEFGIAVHKGLELYDRGVAQGESPDQALLSVVRWAMRQMGQRVEATEEAPARFQPSDPEETLRTRFQLVRTLVWHIDEFGPSDPAKTVILASGEPAVELSFKLPLELESEAGEGFSLAGHLDKVVELGPDLYIKDYKTTKQSISTRWFDQFSPNNQVSLYALAGKIIYKLQIKGVIIDGIQLAQGFIRVRRGFAHRTPGQLQEWLEDLTRWLSLAESCAMGLTWPMNDLSCTHYGGCQFREICAKDPSVRGAFLESGFIRQQWDPTVNRGA